MTTQVSPFRVAVEDLDGLEPKVRNALLPLIENLNVTLGQVVQAIASIPAQGVVAFTLELGPTVADSFPLRFKNPIARRPTYVAMTLRPKNPDHSMTTAFVCQGFNLTDEGLISVPWITGLVASNVYELTFTVTG